MAREKKQDAVPVLGWREWVALPDLHIGQIKAKVDTGARSSALHAFDIEVIKRSGRKRVGFAVHPEQRDLKKTVRTEAPLHDERWVKSSNGKRELRPVIRTHVKLNGESWLVDLTLTDRDNMGFRMLLGREAVRGRFLVNPGRSFLLGKRIKKTKRRKKT